MAAGSLRARPGLPTLLATADEASAYVGRHRGRRRDCHGRFSPMTHRAVISGFATMDYVLATARPLRGPETLLATARVEDAWPRAGGAALYAAAPMSRLGHSVSPIVTIGGDANGDRYLDACGRAGVQLDGIVRETNARTPSCVLIYHDVGGYSCLLDVGGATPAKLSHQQVGLVQEAQLLVVAAALPTVTREILQLARRDQTLAWIFKDDSACFPDDLRHSLGERANIVFCNAGERSWIGDATRTGPIIIETRGAEGVLVEESGRAELLTTAPIVVSDATGAGDTLAGEVLGRILSGETSLRDAVLLGMAAAGTLLVQRAAAESARRPDTTG